MSRAERRRLEREERKPESPCPSRRFKVGRDIIAQGIEPGSDEAKILEDQERGTVEVLAEDQSLQGTVAFVDATVASLDMILEVIAQPLRPLACQSGCSYCCHLKLGASVPEVIALAAHLRTNDTETDLKAVRTRVDAYVERTAGLNGNRRMMAREACPLLADDRCVAYPMRPLTCRGWNSLDVSYCRRDFESPESRQSALLFRPQIQAARSVLAGIEAGLSILGLQHDQIDLVAGLRIALDAPLEELHRRWRAGEPVFDTARDDAQTREAMEQWTTVRPCADGNSSV